MNTKIILSLSLLLAISFSSCKDDDSSSDTTPALSKTDMLIAGSWIQYDSKIDGVSDWDDWDACDRDDEFTFKADGNGTISEGATKCDPDDEDSWFIAWKFVNNETQISLDGEIHDIEMLTADRFTFSYFDEYSSEKYQFYLKRI